MTGTNDIFLIKNIKRSATSGLIIATTEAGENIIIEEDLLCPFIRGEDISQFSYSPGGYIIWTHDDNGKVLDRLPYNAEQYFQQEPKQKRLRKNMTTRKACQFGPFLG